MFLNSTGDVKIVEHYLDRNNEVRPRKATWMNVDMRDGVVADDEAMSTGVTVGDEVGTAVHGA
jgi:hypothetical protein